MSHPCTRAIPRPHPGAYLVVRDTGLERTFAVRVMVYL